MLNGVLSFMGQKIMFLDMIPTYPAPAFSWATSLFVQCTSEDEFDAVFKGLSQDGFAMMGRKLPCTFANVHGSQINSASHGSLCGNKEHCISILLLLTRFARQAAGTFDKAYFEEVMPKFFEVIRLETLDEVKATMNQMAIVDFL